MKTIRNTKHFGLLVNNNFEFNGQNYTRIGDSNMARNDETGKVIKFDDYEVVTELTIKF